MSLKKTLVAAAIAASAGTLHAQQAQQGQTAQTPAPPAAAPVTPWSFNVGVVSDYRFRGLSQSHRRPALQGGIDYGFANGAYIGTWISTIRFIDKLGGDGPAEVDLYVGHRGKAWDDRLAYDVGLLRYQYPHQNFNGPSFNTNEAYAALTYGPATVKYSYSLNDKTFGFTASTASYYLEAAATFETGWWGLAITPHVGHQHFHRNPGASYTDWSLGLSKDFGNGLAISASYVDTSGAPRAIYTIGGRYIGKAGGVLGAKYTF